MKYVLSFESFWNPIQKKVKKNKVNLRPIKKSETTASPGEVVISEFDHNLAKQSNGIEVDIYGNSTSS